MPNDRQSSIRFSLEDYVLFKSGQEVDELISISLNPNISIIDENDYIVLKGSLELQGEYRRNEPEDSDKDLDVGDKYVQLVEEREEGECVFSYHFPVDITIPQERIASLDEIFIEVESFDYHLPDQSRLNIDAEIFVYGLQADQIEEIISGDHTKAEIIRAEQPEDLEQIDEANPSLHDQSAESRPVEKYLMNDGEEEEQAVEVELTRLGEEQPEAEMERESLQLDEIAPQASIEEETEEAAEESLNDEALYEPFTIETRVNAMQEHEEVKQENQQADQAPEIPFPLPAFHEMNIEDLIHRTEESSHVYHESTSHAIEMESSSKESSSHESSEVSEKKKEIKKKKDKYKSMSFADFFAKRDDEKHAILKIRLVQQGDSIQRIADQYEISAQQIVRANELDPTQELSEGQVLYIPVKTNHRRS